MTKNDLHYISPAGLEAYQVFKSLCIIVRNTSEGSREPERPTSPKTNPRSPRLKPRSAHKVQEVCENKSDDYQPTSIFATTFHNTQLYLANLKFPCPIGMSTCPEISLINPVDRWSRMDKGKLCYSCLLPNNV